MDHRPFPQKRCPLILTGAIAAVAILALPKPSSLGVTTTNWTLSSGSANWNTAGDWSNGIPNAAGTIATDTGVTSTATLNLAETVGQIECSANGKLFTIGISGTNALTLDNTGGSNNFFGESNAFIGVNSSTAGGGDAIQIQSNIIIANTNLDIGTEDAGLQIGASVNTSTITAATNQTLNFLDNTNFAASNNRNILVDDSIGLSGANIAIVNKTTTGGTGTITLAGSVGGSVTSISDTANSGNFTISEAITSVAAITDAATGSGNFTISGAMTNVGSITDIATSTGNAVLSLNGVISGATSLLLNSANQSLFVNNVNPSWTGPITVSAGRLEGGSGDSLGTSAVSISSGGQFFSNAATTTVTNSFTITGNGGSFSLDGAFNDGAIRLQNTTLSGLVTVAGAAAMTVNSGDTATLTGQITGAGALTLYSVFGNGVMLLENTSVNANNWSGGLTISGGNNRQITVKLTAPGQIPSGLGFGDVAISAGTSAVVLDLDGNSATLNGLNSSVNANN